MECHSTHSPRLGYLAPPSLSPFATAFRIRINKTRLSTFRIHHHFLIFALLSAHARYPRRETPRPCFKGIKEDSLFLPAPGTSTGLACFTFDTGVTSPSEHSSKEVKSPHCSRNKASLQSLFFVRKLEKEIKQIRDAFLYHREPDHCDLYWSSQHTVRGFGYTCTMHRRNTRSCPSRRPRS